MRSCSENREATKKQPESERRTIKGSKVRKGEHDGETLGDRGNELRNAAVFPLSPVVSPSYPRPAAGSAGIQ